MTALHQAVVLCGGRGSRMAPLLGDLPKVLADTGQGSLLELLLQDLARAGTRQVILLAGPSGGRIADGIRGRVPPELDVQIIQEPAHRGTAGALHGAAHLFRERFLLVFGDVYTSLDWKRFTNAAESFGGLGTLLVHRSNHPEDSDLVALDDSCRVVGWVGRTPEQRRRAVTTSVALTNAGIAVLHRDVLQRIPTGRACDLTGEVMPALVDARAPLFGYLTSEFVRDAGTPDRFAEVSQAIADGSSRRRAELCLLDRDGVVVDGTRAPRSEEEVRLIPGATKAIRRLNDAGIEVVVVSNQGGVARGLYDEPTLLRMQARVNELLALEGARLDGFHYCPHHPETHWNEGVAALRGPCTCRKPGTALVDRALEESSREAWRAVVVGDQTSDMQLALNCGLPGIAVDTGHGCRDGLFPARPTWRFPSLEHAAAWLTGESGDMPSNAPRASREAEGAGRG